MAEIHNCDIIKDLLPGYADHLLSEAGAEAVKEHLTHCDSCRRIYQEMTDELKTEPASADRLALDGFRKIRQRTRRLRLAAGIACGLLLLLVCGILLFLFVIGRPVSFPDEFSSIYHEEDESVTIEGDFKNFNIGRVKWERDPQNENIIYLLFYETAALPFVPEKSSFSVTIPDVKGCEVYQALPNYDRIQLYSWENDHRELVDQLKEEIYRRIPAFTEETDLLQYAGGL